VSSAEAARTAARCPPARMCGHFDDVQRSPAQPATEVPTATVCASARDCHGRRHRAGPLTRLATAKAVQLVGCLAAPVVQELGRERRIKMAAPEGDAMGFGAAVSACLRKYATFSGTAPRSEYWWFVLFYVAAYVIAAVLDVALNTLFLLQPLVILALLLPLLAAAVRRLHDTGRSGWWYLVGLVPFIGGIWLLVLLTRPTDYDRTAAYA